MYEATPFSRGAERFPGDNISDVNRLSGGHDALATWLPEFCPLMGTRACRANHNPVSCLPLEPARRLFAHQENASLARSMAGEAGFLIFTQLGDMAGRYGRSSSLETKPSRPIRQACRNSPISPRSKSEMKIPSTRRANSRARFVFRIVRGSFRISSPSVTAYRRHRTAPRHACGCAGRRSRRSRNTQQYGLAIQYKRCRPDAQRGLGD